MKSCKGDCNASKQVSLDIFYQSACPTVPMQIYDELPEMMDFDKYLMIAADGAYPGIKRPYLLAIAKFNNFSTAVFVLYG